MILLPILCSFFFFFRLGRLAQVRAYRFWLHPDIIFRFSSHKKEQDRYLKIVHSLTEKVIQKRKREYETKKRHQLETGETENEEWTVVIDSLLAAIDDDGVGLTDEDIKAEVMTMMFAVSTYILIFYFKIKIYETLSNTIQYGRWKAKK